MYWLSTVRPDGRPHVTPLLGIWQDGALYFCTGPDERKAKNLARNPHCILTTGCNRLDGLDLVVEGQATKVSDPAELRSDDVARLAALGLPGSAAPVVTALAKAAMHKLLPDIRQPTNRIADPYGARGCSPPHR